MSFVNTQYLTMAIVVVVVIAIILNRLNASYFKWVKSYWFFDRTWMSRFSSFFYMLSLLLLLLSLLDLRGPEKKIRASLPDQRTIILIDTSASMLAEDVRPSRFVKSLQMARHFVKSAAGHQISIVLFSDIQKRLIPFTDDIDLLDSRLAALEKTNSVAGGTNISQAIEESIQYFEFDSGEDDKAKSGNMLVFTDAEEGEGEFKVHIPPNVNLAVVGVGTLKGSNIPLRWDDGSFRGYKTFKGEPIVTKLDENFLKKMATNIKSYKYWIANSYSLPTDEIMNFFRAAYNKKQSAGDMRVRPVYSHYILIPAIILYCISVLLGRFAIFKMSKNLILIFTVGLALSTTAKAQGTNQQKEKPINPEIQKDLDVVKSGKADRDYVLKVAEKLLRDKDEKRATELYSEYSKNNDEEAIRFNYATSLLKENRQAEARPIIQELLKNSKNEDLKNKLRHNILLSMDPKKRKEREEQQKKEDQQNQDKKDQDQKNGNDQKNDEQKKKEEEEKKKSPNFKNRKGEDQDTQKKNQGQQGQQDQKNSQDQKNAQSQKNEQQNGQQKRPDSKEPLGKERENKKDEKKGNEKDKKEKKDSKGDGDEQDKDDQQSKGPSTLEEKEKEIEQKRRMVKTPAMIKQIMSDDRDLQRKMMDTSTSERGEQRPKRDW